MRLERAFDVLSQRHTEYTVILVSESLADSQSSRNNKTGLPHLHLPNEYASSQVAIAQHTPVGHLNKKKRDV